MQAVIYKSTGSWYLAKTNDGSFWQCRIKGKLKIDTTITSTNPIAVGDFVEIEPEVGQGNSAMITNILDRKNYIVRVSPHNKNQKHIVASNMDTSMIIATIKDPKTSTGFIDRNLVTCEAYHIPAIIVMNKADILNEKEKEYFQYLKTMYHTAGYPIYLISVEKKTGLDSLLDALHNKTSLITGHSGVGKSTFINTILPERELRVQEVSAWSGKGMHTTTFAEMFDLPNGGQIIDTPGIRELGIVDMERAELGGYYPEIRIFAKNCKYNNCLHLNEPGCGVKEAVRSKRLIEERYINYVKILDTIEDKGY